MKTSQKISCQPIITRKRASKKGLVKTELEIFELSEFSILALNWNRKLGKLGNFFKTSKFEWISFVWKKLGISEVSEFLILALTLKSKTRKTRKFPNSSKKTNPLKFMSWKDFRVFQVFDFSIRAKIESSETSEIAYFLK